MTRVKGSTGSRLLRSRLRAEATILTRLRAWAPGVALLVISHRASVLAAADRIIRLEPDGAQAAPDADAAGLSLGVGGVGG